MALLDTALAIVLYPMAVEYKPIFAASHCVPLTLPALNAHNLGIHIMRPPAPLAGVRPLIESPVAKMAPPAVTRVLSTLKVLITQSTLSIVPIKFVLATVALLPVSPQPVPPKVLSDCHEPFPTASLANT